jgi:D-galactarolactone isomerase
MTNGKSIVSGFLGSQICDAHMHVFQLPLPAASGQTQITADVPVGALSEYRTIAERLGVRRHVVVQPSPFGSDNRTTLAAVRSFGAQARAVVIPTAHAGEEEIARLSAAGSVAARIFLLRDTGLGIEHVKRTADLVADFGWHLEVQCEGERLPELIPLLHSLRVPSVIDHLGRMPKGTPTNGRLFGAVLEHVKSGRGWVKLSAPYHNSRSHTAGFDDLRPQVEALAYAAPERLVWATNWPHVRFREKPDDLALADVLLGLLPDPALVRRVLVENPALLYRFP